MKKFVFATIAVIFYLVLPAQNFDLKFPQDYRKMLKDAEKKSRKEFEDQKASLMKDKDCFTLTVFIPKEQCYVFFSKFQDTICNFIATGTASSFMINLSIGQKLLFSSSYNDGGDLEYAAFPKNSNWDDPRTILCNYFGQMCKKNTLPYTAP